MTTYCFTTKDGKHTVERRYPRGEAPKSIMLRSEDNGFPVRAYRDYRAELSPVHSTGAGWPIVCIGSGVNANQAQELRDELKRCGVPTEVTGGGNPVYRDASHRRRALKARGLIDKSSYC